MTDDPGSGAPSPGPDDGEEEQPEIFGNWGPESQPGTVPPPLLQTLGRFRPQREAVEPSHPARPFGLTLPAPVPSPAPEPEWLAPPELAAPIAPRANATSRLVREVVETLLLALLVFLGVRASVQHYRVEGHSMDPTLEDGEFLIVNTLLYSEMNVDRLDDFVPFVEFGEPDKRHVFHGPKRGEIIILHDPTPRNGPDLVKRIIGVPGDTVEIVDGVVFISGRALTEPYVKVRWSGGYPRTELGPKMYFVMGDNRLNSSDSRVFGPVHEDFIVGKALFSWWPKSKLGRAPNEAPQFAPEATRP